MGDIKLRSHAPNLTDDEERPASGSLVTFTLKYVHWRVSIQRASAG